MQKILDTAELLEVYFMNCYFFLSPDLFNFKIEYFLNSDLNFFFYFKSHLFYFWLLLMLRRL